MSGEPTVGSIIGYLRLDRSDWDTELDAAGRKADELSRHSPNIRVTTNAPSAIAQLALVAAAVKRLQDAQGAENVAQTKLSELQAKGNASAGQLAAAEERLQRAHRATAAATIQLAAAHDVNDTAMRRATTDAEKLANATDNVGNASKKAEAPTINLWAALAAISPSAIQMAGVAGGALLGVVPVIAAVTLGVKGITNEMASGRLAGTKYGADIKSVQSELTKLETISAGDILSGLDRALTATHGLFPVVNSDIDMMSTQIGNIIAKGGPALLSLLTDLNPLFVTFGDLLTRGADELDGWATSSTGVKSFVNYVQAELPKVMQFLGETVLLFSHLAQGAAPFGGVILTDLTLFVRVLDAIPVGVLREAIPVVTALYVAFKAYQGITFVMTKVSTAVDVLKAKMVTFAAASASETAAAQANAAASAEASAQVAEAELEQAQAAALSAAQTAEALEGTSSVLAASAGEAADWAASQVAAFRAAALAARESATQIALAADEAAAAARAAGPEAATGWAEIAGPIGAVAVGLGILATSFFGSGASAAAAAAQVDTYTDAIKADNDAIGENTRQAVVNALQKAGALTAARTLGLSLQTVTDAALGNAAALKIVNAATAGYYTGGYATEASTSRVGEAANKLNSVLGDQTSAVNKAKTAAENEAAAMAHSAAATALNSVALKSATNDVPGYTSAAHQLTAAQQASAAAAIIQAANLGITVGAYNTASTAAAANKIQTQQQTVAWQLANDAASLLGQTLDALSGKTVSYAEADNQFESQLVSLAKGFDGGSKSVKGLSEAAIANRGSLLSARDAAITTAQAYVNLHQPIDGGRAELEKLRQQIINNTGTTGAAKAAVTKYVDSILAIPKTIPKTVIEADKSKADATVKALQTEIDNIRQRTEPGLGVLTQSSKDEIATLQRQIDSLTGKTVLIQIDEVLSKSNSTYSNQRGNTAAVRGGDSPDSAGETSLTANNTAGNVTVTPNVSLGGIVTVTPKKTSTSSKASKVNVPFAGIDYSSERAASNAAVKALANLSKGVAAFGGSLLKSESTLATASTELLNDAKAAGVSQAKLTAAEKIRTQLLTASNTLASAENRLKTDQAAAASEAASVKSATLGAFDITTATANSGVGIQAQALQAANTVKVWAADLLKLKAKKLAPGLINQLAQGGIADLPQVIDLLQLSASGISSVNTSVAGIAGIGGSLGATVAAGSYAKQLALDLKSVALDTKTVDALGKELAKELAVTIKGQTYVVKWNDKEVATLVATGAAKNVHRGK